MVRLSLLVPLAAICSFACGGSSPDSPSSQPSLDQALTRGAAVAAPSLGAAANFALLAGTAVTCTDATVAGNVGVYPGISITQTSCPVTGTIDAGDAAAAQAHNDFLLAYDQYKALPCDRTLTTLDGQTLSPGVYCFDAAATSTGGVLTLSGPANGSWVFKIGTLGTGALTGTGFSVITPGGSAPACNNVVWWAAEAVTMTDSKLVGTILAGAATTLTRGTFNGNAYAKAAATITGVAVTACAAPATPPPICKARDFVTGAGFVRGTPSGTKAAFSVAGGIKRGAFVGHLTYDDQGRNGVRVSSARVTAYVVLDSQSRRVEGTAKVNGRSGFTWQADVKDGGERGRNDTFSLRLSNGYRAAGSLGSGDIQLQTGSVGGHSCGGADGDDEDDHDGEDDDDHDDDHHHHQDNGHEEGGR